MRKQTRLFLLLKDLSSAGLLRLRYSVHVVSCSPAAFFIHMNCISHLELLDRRVRHSHRACAHITLELARWNIRLKHLVDLLQRPIARLREIQVREAEKNYVGPEPDVPVRDSQSSSRTNVGKPGVRPTRISHSSLGSRG